MTRATYAPKEEYLGDGSLAVYTFDFKIESLLQLEIIEIDDSDVETQRVRGNDVTYLSSVDFDALEGGGTVTLAANLTAGYTLLILEANDAPTQAHEFRNKGSFSLRRIETALDFVAGAIQRLAYRGKQALRIHDADNEETFDAQFPPGVVAAAERYLKVNDTGTGFEYGFTIDELADLVLPDGAVAGDIMVWNGTDYVPLLNGGGMYVSTLQSIAAGAQITINTAIQQFLKVQGDSGPQITSNAPFSAPPRDGTIIMLRGTSNANPLTIPYADTAQGCMLKGDCTLGLNDTLTLVYDLAEQRYWELSRD